MVEQNLPIKCIAVHVTDSPDTLDIGRKEINQWHKERGWGDGKDNCIGYHYVVRRRGKIEIGRPEGVIGSHVAGHNTHSIGVVWVGKDAPDSEQYYSLVCAVACLLRKHRLGAINVRGHKEFPGVTKSCPNLDMDKLRADVAKRLTENDPHSVGSSCGVTGGLCVCAVDRKKTGAK